MKKAIKAIYILLVGMVVFTGALLIMQGVREREKEETAISMSVRRTLPDNEPGNMH